MLNARENEVLIPFFLIKKAQKTTTHNFLWLLTTIVALLERTQFIFSFWE